MVRLTDDCRIGIATLDAPLDVRRRGMRVRDGGAQLLGHLGQRPRRVAQRRHVMPHVVKGSEQACTQAVVACHSEGNRSHDTFLTGIAR
ncbi:hypothetical protein [Pandoraea apista]|uniref:hypothetical protein n=1 Tax=Pandoraea apista TaxID=93218 RepID=UPI0021ADD562|nr:hypothetical protein [Pandoraea apista]